MGSVGLNKKMIGFNLQETLKPVTKQEILSFAQATKDENPLYLEKDAIAPPLFIFKLFLPQIKKLLCLKELKINILRMVHSSQEILWHRPIKVGKQLKLEVNIKNIHETPAGELMEVSGHIYSGNKLSAEGVAGLLIRNKKKSSKKRMTETETDKKVFRIELPTEEGQQIRYAKASGDHNFIHTNNFLAKMVGLPGTIIHGACLMAMICSALSKKIIDNDLTRLSSMKGRFSYPVIPGEKLTLVGYDSQEKQVFPFEVFNPAGKLVFKRGTLKIN
jgi:acyl dehydratase